MLRIIKTEIVKLKRSYMLWLCVLGSLCAPLLNWIILLQSNYDSSDPFKHFMMQTNMLTSIIIGTLLYGLFTTYVFEREFTDNMYKHLFTVPISKIKLLISKLFIVSTGLLLLTLTSYIFGVIFSIISGLENITLSNMIYVLSMYLKTYIVFIPLMIPVIFVTLVFRGFVAPIAFSIIAEVILFIAIQSKYIALYPWSAPTLVGTTLVDNVPESELIGAIHWNIISLICVGIISFIGILIYLEKKEIC